jgi:hypothetical protein
MPITPVGRVMCQFQIPFDDFEKLILERFDFVVENFNWYKLSAISLKEKLIDFLREQANESIEMQPPAKIVDNFINNGDFVSKLHDFQGDKNEFPSEEDYYAALDKWWEEVTRDALFYNDLYACNNF